VEAQHTAIDVGNALLSLAADRGDDLLVIGAYGHTRCRELVLGGVTRTLLQSMTIPVLMAR
jgi:nucleotide-binding universal stress UspA family protein